MLRINVIELKNFKPAEEKLFRDMLELTGRVLNSEEFRQAVLNFRYTYTKKYWFKKDVKIISPRFAYTDETNEEVYRKFMLGFDDSTGIDHEIDVKVEAYYSNNGVIGSAYVGP